jgi:hypothetical protein
MINKLTSGIPANKRSVLRQLEDLLPQIEDGLARGYTHAVMHAALPEVGIQISLQYYHRVLHMLRQERRQGKKSGRIVDLSSAPSDSPPEADQLPTPLQAKTGELSNAIAEGTPGQLATIDTAAEGATLFKYRGQALLQRDWAKF